MYNEYFHINKNFQSSINLELDFNNKNKIDEYVPTTDICDVLKFYLKTFLGLEKNKATTLVGPYGKGKSFLLLILTFIVSNNKNSKEWINLAKRIKIIDEDLFELLMQIKENDVTLLPIIINSNYDNIKQSFQIALNNSLKREGLIDIIPNTVYDVCLGLISKWEKDPKIKDELFKKCIEINNINLNKLKIELKNFSIDAYHKFENLYNCVNIGLDFNPLVNNDVVKIYSDVSLEISKKGYKGIFIIFDEFSKFLEDNSSNLMQDLKIIQDFAELAARSSKISQINLCCVTHKNLSLYLKRNSNIILDSFKTVEGRFIEVKFNRSVDENYQLISYAIKKDAYTNKLIDKVINDNKEFYNKIDDLKLFTNEISHKYLFKGCFPLNPLTVYCLIQLSEFVAQNERTLFTFLSDSDENSFNTFIHNNDSGLFNVDKIYDYFSDLLQKEEANYIRNIWYRCESILSKDENQIEKKILKVIAVLLMINNIEKLPVNENIISLSLDLPLDIIEKHVKFLIDKHLIRRNILNNMLSFALSSSKQIDENIEYLEKTKFRNIQYNDILNKINDIKYLIPRRYNEENKITRFFSVIFMSEDEFKNIINFDYYFENKYCDGLVINLLKEKLTDKEIKEKINKINDMRVIIKIPCKNVCDNFYKLIMRFACLEDIKFRNDVDEITLEEISLFSDETELDIKELIELYFYKDFKYFSVYNRKIKFNELMSEILDNIYPFKLIFNNELVNKKTVSSQYQKAINHVIDYLLDNIQDFNYSETSPENTIKFSVLDYNKNDNNFRIIINEIKEFIKNANNKRLILANIADKYRKAPYGIKNGVIPILFAQAISELSDNVILYLHDKEILLDSNNLVKAVDNEHYTLSFSKKSKEQENYLKEMLELFDVKSNNDFKKDYILLVDNIRKYFVGLPKIIRSCKINNNYLNADEKTLEYKNLFLDVNINQYDVIFNKPKKIFNTNKYNNLINEIINIKNNILNLINNFKLKCIKLVKNAFNIDELTCLKMGLNEWIKNNNYNQKMILSETSRNCYNCIVNELDFNDLNSINLISKKLLNLYIEDWDSDKSELLQEELNKFINELSTAQIIDSDGSNNLNNIIDSFKDDELSPMGDLLKNNLESIFDEFSDSVTPNEKIAILSELINKLL